MSFRSPSILGLLWRYLWLRVAATRTSTRLLVVLVTLGGLLLAFHTNSSPERTLGPSAPASASDASKARIGPVTIGTRPSEGSHRLDPTDRLPRGSTKLLGCNLAYRDLPAGSGFVELRWLYWSGEGGPEEIHSASYALSGSGTHKRSWVDQKRGGPSGRYTCRWSWAGQEASASLQVR